MSIKVTSRILNPAREDCISETHRFRYASHSGLELIEHRTIQGESDFANGIEERLSPDNGRTWGEWKNVYENYLETYGEDELEHQGEATCWNPVHKHYVGCRFDRFYDGGHIAAYEKFWEQGQRALFDHQYLLVRKEGESTPYQADLIRYEDGADFDPKNPRNPEYLNKNIGFINIPSIAANGDVLMPVSPFMDTACRIAGIDANKIFPSCPHLMRGLLVMRAHWNGEHYDMQFSNPIVISDTKSSRGFDEPMVTELRSGRVLLIARGSNTQNRAWNTRIQPGTPGFKWHAWSDDGGKTFTDPAPWHFDTGEVVYSSATISYFIRNECTGKLYWVGNITGPNVNGNFPRYPLCIVEVNDETGCLIRDTLTVIDTRHEGEPETVQLSNFWMYQNRETGNLHLTLSRIGQFGNAQVWKSDCMEYIIEW